MTDASLAPAEHEVLTVALVDDDPMWRFLTSTALREKGWTVHDFESGSDLIRQLATLSVDVVLIDALMPDMDGFDTCRAIRLQTDTANLPILMLTSLEDDESIGRAYQVGATDFFIKSTHWALLVERIRHLVRLSDIGRQLDRSNAHLAKVHTLARTGTFDFDFATRTFGGGQGSFAVLGLPESLTELPEAALFELMSPQDVDRARQEVEAAVVGRRAFRVEFPIRSPDGKTRYICAEGEPVYDSDDRVHVLRGLIRDKTDDHSHRQELDRLARHDPLTGLPNRDEFLKSLSAAIEQARSQAGEVHVAIFDLDRFTQFNETLGQGVGDELIRQVGRRLVAEVGERRAASGIGRGAPEFVVARLPGDEFAILMNNLGGADGAEALIQAVMASLRQAFHVAGVECFLSASVGLASFPRDADTAGLLLSRADRATREVKSRGRNDVGWYLPSLEQGGRGRIEMVAGLHRALEREEFELHFQPWVDVVAGRVTGLEALVRWRRDGKLVPPAEFIPVAEDTGLIVPIGEWVLARAARALAGWRASGLALERVAVNIPTVHFERDSLLSVLREAMRRHGLRARSLELELTETCMVRDFERTLPRLEALIEAGATLAIDDFGTGYSSLAYLTRLPISKLKVDRAFVDQLGVSRQGAAVCKAIVALGQSLDVQVLAEGVETPEQVRALLALGCRTMQGFLFSRPVPAEQVPAAIRAAEQVALGFQEPATAARSAR